MFVLEFYSLVDTGERISTLVLEEMFSISDASKLNDSLELVKVPLLSLEEEEEMSTISGTSKVDPKGLSGKVDALFFVFNKDEGELEILGHSNSFIMKAACSASSRAKMKLSEDKLPSQLKFSAFMVKSYGVLK